MSAIFSPSFLLIDTATELCSVAVSIGNEIIATKESNSGFSHAEHLLPFIDEVLSSHHIEKKQLSAVVLSNGPGSYTGLRIGSSTAKGLCYALQIPLIAISTLETIARALSSSPSSSLPTLFCPMIDARRMEVYTAIYSSDFEIVKQPHSLIVTPNAFEDLLKNNIIIFCGNGMPKCQNMLSNAPNARFSNAPLSAVNMLTPALEKFENHLFEDIAYFEPFYLKDYIAKKSVVKGLQ